MTAAVWTLRKAAFGARAQRGRARRRSVRRLRCVAKETVKTYKAPAPLAAYSQGTKAGNLLFVGGQLGILPGAKQLISQDPGQQAKQAMKNMGAILDEAGASFDNVVKTTLLLSEIEDFKEVNAVYATFFPGEPPARVAFAVKALPMNAKKRLYDTDAQRSDPRDGGSRLRRNDDADG